MSRARVISIAFSLVIIVALLSITLSIVQPAVFAQTYEKRARSIDVYHGTLDVPKDSTASLTFSIPSDATNIRLKGSYEGHGGNQMLQFSVGGNCSRHNDMNSCKQSYLIETKALGQVYVNLDPGKTYVAQFRNPQEYWGLVGQEKQVEAALNADYDQLVLVSGSNNSPQGGQKSGCLIATAAFGSELTPQVQFLREFRDQRILATASGSSFMAVFNAWYYSFSPAVADYEREQPWLQNTVKVGIYPLLGILYVAEQSYSLIPGEYGSISAGLMASSLIGAVYFTPLALSIKQVRTRRLDYRIGVIIMAALAIGIIASLAVDNMIALTVLTAVLVLSALGLAAIYSAQTLSRLFGRLRGSKF